MGPAYAAVAFPCILFVLASQLLRLRRAVGAVGRPRSGSASAPAALSASSCP